MAKSIITEMGVFFAKHGNCIISKCFTHGYNSPVPVYVVVSLFRRRRHHHYHLPVPLLRLEPLLSPPPSPQTDGIRAW